MYPALDLSGKWGPSFDRAPRSASISQIGGLCSVQPLQSAATAPQPRVRERQTMAVDAEVQAFLDEVARLQLPPLQTLSPAEGREQMILGSALMGPGEPVERIEERHVPGPAGTIPVRLYWPTGAPPAAPLPVVVYFHGGGWVLGSVDTHDGYCRALANATAAVVASVEYRLAPEHRYPAAVDDAFAATVGVSRQAAAWGLDAGRLAVAGDSAGGNLAAVVAMLARDRAGPPIRFQLLLYPITDCDFETPSYRENGEGFYLTRDAMRWFFDLYVPRREQMFEPLVSPLRATAMTGLPPALVITAEYDPLRDEAERYAARLRDAGVPTTLSRYSGTIHGFARRYATWSKAQAALAEVGATLRGALR